MRSRIFLGGLLAALLAEFAVLLWFACPRAEHLQDTVTINEIVQTVQSDWHSLEAHHNPTV